MGLSFCCSGPLLFFYIAIVTAVASLPVATELSVPVVLLAVTELSVVGGSAVSGDVGCGGVVCGIGCIASTMLCLPHHYLYSYTPSVLNLNYCVRTQLSGSGR